jgi:hypothetical protein
MKLLPDFIPASVPALRPGSPKQVRKFEWDIDPDDMKNPTIHGLRGTGIPLRFLLGFEVDQIANDVGMSGQMVESYMRFKDQMEVGRPAALGCGSCGLAFPPPIPAATICGSLGGIKRVNPRG